MMNYYNSNNPNNTQYSTSSITAKYVGFGEAIKRFFQKYATFNGRATRSEYWWSYLFTVLVNIVLSIIVYSMFNDDPDGSLAIIGLFSIVSIIFILPSIAIAVRRLHDTGRSGLFYLFILIPFIGMFILIIFCAQKSVGPNQWGPPAQEKDHVSHTTTTTYQKSYQRTPSYDHNTQHMQDEEDDDFNPYLTNNQQSDDNDNDDDNPYLSQK